MRLTFVGDIECDKPLLKAARAKNYDFSDVFHAEDLFSKSDLVIGNMEACFGGGKKYNYKPYHYNTPDSFCQAVYEAGINLVGTANNHCFDEGVGGVIRTIQTLKRCGIEHTGTFASEESKRYLIKEVGETKIAFYSLAHAVNSCFEASSVDDLSKYVNLIGYRKQKFSKNWLLQQWQRFLRPKAKQIYKRCTIGSIIGSYQDSLKSAAINQSYLQRTQQHINDAKKEADIVCVLLHIGGQFNEVPGDYAEYIVNMLCDMGVDVIIGHHPHTIQKLEKRNNTWIAWSLGAFSISPSGEYLVHNCLPEYGMVLSVDIEEKEVKTISYELVKNLEDEGHYLRVLSVPELLKLYDGDRKRRIEKDVEVLKKRIGM